MPFVSVPPLPSLKVQIAFDSGFSTLEGDRTWTDVSAYVEGDQGIDITYGRADELSQADPNTCSVTLDNRDGRFTPGKSSSPYFPNVKKGKPIRVTATYSGVDYIRFTGYVNEWPVVWPDGSHAASTVTITATSRRARLGQTAPLTSAIRAAYLATNPVAYWPMDEDAETVTSAGQQAFRDITNPDLPGHNKELIAAFSTTDALRPVVRDGSAGPTDEESLVRMPRYTNSALLATFSHYIGGGAVVNINTTGGYATVELVARLTAYPGDFNQVTLFELFSPGRVQEMAIVAIDERGLGIGAAVSGYILLLDPVTRAVVESQAVSQDLFDVAADGEIHHYAFVLDGAGTVGRIYFDGLLLGTMTIANAMTSPMTQVAMCGDTYNTDAWIGHAAVHNRALSGAEVLAHANAATAATESVSQRVARLAGRIGVPAAEIDVEATIAADLGPQPEAGRSAADVIDEAAASTGGIAYDTRTGHLAVQARNHRYNTSPAFTLSAVLQEIEGDLTAKVDDRYLVNTVQFSRTGTDAAPATVTDDDSIDDYGVYSTTLSIVSSLDQEAEAAAYDLLYRFADGGASPRISQVSVNLTTLSEPQRAAVLNADIGTMFSLGSLTPQAPTDPMKVFFEGASESISAFAHTVTINTTPATAYQNVMILDDAVRGQTDSGNVAAY